MSLALSLTSLAVSLTFSPAFLGTALDWSNLALGLLVLARHDERGPRLPCPCR